MDLQTDQNLSFMTDEGERIYITKLVMEKSMSESYEYFGVEESEDDCIANHLRKAESLQLGKVPHLILPDVSSASGGLPPFVISASLSHNSKKIVVVFFADIHVHRDKTLEEICQLYLHQINFAVLAGIDREENRKMFEWYQRN